MSDDANTNPTPAPAAKTGGAMKPFIGGVAIGIIVGAFAGVLLPEINRMGGPAEVDPNAPTTERNAAAQGADAPADMPAEGDAESMAGDAAAALEDAANDAADAVEDAADDAGDAVNNLLNSDD